MAVQRQQRRRSRGIQRLVGLSLLLACMGLGALVIAIYRAGQRDDHRHADVIIVLGAAQYDGRPSPVYRARLDHAWGLYRAGAAGRLLCTGGRRPQDRFTEADAGALYLRQRGVPSRAILREPDGRTTLESMRAATTIMRRHHLRTAILVSDPFHAFRLHQMARDLGMQATISPAAHSRVRSLQAQAYFISREVAVYVIYRLARM